MILNTKPIIETELYLWSNILMYIVSYCIFIAYKYIKCDRHKEEKRFVVKIYIKTLLCKPP